MSKCGSSSGGKISSRSRLESVLSSAIPSSVVSQCGLGTTRSSGGSSHRQEEKRQNEGSWEHEAEGKGADNRSRL